MSKRKRRLKRSHLASYAAHRVHVPRTANQDIINAYHERTRSVSGRKDQVEPIPNNTFMQVVPQRRGLRDPSEDYAIEHDKAGNPVKVKTKPARTMVIEKLHALWQSELQRQGIDDFEYFVVRVKTSTYTLKLFTSGNRYCWVREEGTYAKRSPIYNGKEKAEMAFNTTIPWIEVWTLTSPPE